MKKVTLFTVILCAISFGVLNAQTNQGKVLIGVSSTLSLAGAGSELMNLGYSSMTEKSDADDFVESEPFKMTSINLLPKAGYFVIENLALGLDAKISMSMEKEAGDSDKSSTRVFSVGPFARYYIPTSKVLPFFEISGSIGAINYKYDYADNSNWEDTEYKSGVISFGGGIGLAAPLGEKVTIDILAGYDSITVKDKEDNDDNYRSAIGTLGLKIGFTILLGSNEGQK
jgi:hypothetical protein